MAEPCDGQNPGCAKELARNATALEQIAAQLTAMNGSLRKHENRITLLEDHDQYQEEAIRGINERHIQEFKAEKQAREDHSKWLKRLVIGALVMMCTTLIATFISFLGSKLLAVIHLL